MNLEMQDKPVTMLDPEQLRGAMRAWSAGVTVVAAAFQGARHGMTVNSFSSISLDPPWITIALKAATRTHELVSRARTFGITVLTEDQADLSDRFAGRVEGLADRFDGLLTETLVTGSPFIVGGLAWMDCRVVHTFDAGENTLFIGEVVAARGEGAGRPLIYHNRVYWKLSKP